MRLAGHVTCLIKMRKAYRVLIGNSERRRLLEDLELAGKIILKLYLNSVASSCTRFIAVKMGDQWRVL